MTAWLQRLWRHLRPAPEDATVHSWAILTSACPRTGYVVLTIPEADVTILLPPGRASQLGATLNRHAEWLLARADSN